MRTGIDDSLNLLKNLEVKLKSRASEGRDPRTKTQQDQQISRRGQAWGERLTTAFENMEGKLQQENKQLKRYVNKLLRMNDYLKNQLIKGQHFDNKSKSNIETNSEVGMLRMEIEYLRELNREKQLQIQLLNQRRTKDCRCNTTVFQDRRRINPVSISSKNIKSNGKTTLRKISTSALKKSSIDLLSSKSFTAKKKKCRLCY